MLVLPHFVLKVMKENVFQINSREKCIRRILMKVLHLNAGNETGGGMVHILSLLNELKSENIYLGLFEEGIFQQEALKRGIQTVTFTQKNRYDLSIISRVIQFIRNNQIDMIHTHGARANLYGYFIKKR